MPEPGDVPDRREICPRVVACLIEHGKAYEPVKIPGVCVAPHHPSITHNLVKHQNEREGEKGYTHPLKNDRFGD